MHLKEFILSKIFRKHVVAALLLTIVLLWLTMLILSFYTHRGESLAIPDFTGLTMNEARQVAKKMNLRFELEDSVYKADRKVGTILTQNPGPGHKIKSGRMIYLTLVSSIPGQEEVPKVTDISLRQARVLLESKGFAIGRVEYIPSEFNDLVLDQKSKGVSLVPGTRLDNGATIDLVVGQNGGSFETFVPNFTGLTMSEVLILLKSRQLQSGAIQYDATIKNQSDSMAARVITQFPLADSTTFIPAGSAVNLVLSLSAKE
ncbi:MAG: PASTA domain-containing protein [Prolixibacteraceae bacterium]|jgi:beta-lactam-binding protein with PASTA domain|nr:PASTA domain-containing protein [Prolixibacteraceae bacterium]